MAKLHEVTDMLPLTHLSLHILLALTKGDLHGYGVIREVRDNSGSGLNPGTGTFYSAIRRMLEEDLIHEVASNRGKSDDARRRYYSLTDFGRKVLQAEVERLEILLKSARAAVAPQPARD